MFINEPWLIDNSIFWEKVFPYGPEEAIDNLRVYIPLDLNKVAILRRSDHIIHKYGEVNWKNEFNFSVDVERLIRQLEIYDQFWYIRNMPKEGKHSIEAKELVREFIERLDNILDGGADQFPFKLIDELTEEYLG